MEVSMGKSSMVDLKKSPVCLQKGKLLYDPGSQMIATLL